MTIHSNRVIKITRNINATISLRNIPKMEFFKDVNQIKIDLREYKAKRISKLNYQIKSLDFQDKYLELFDGTFSEFGKTSGRPINSFLGATRLMTNPKHYSTITNQVIVSFNNDFRKKTVKPKTKKKAKVKKTKKLNVQLPLTKFHSYYSDRLIKGSPVNFLKKYVIIYRFKQKRIGKIGFESGKQILDNFPIIKPLINYDLTILNNFFKIYYNNSILASSFGFLIDFELYDSKTQKYSDYENISQRTLISVGKTMIESEQLNKLKILIDRFMNITSGKTGSNLHYYIYKSRIMLTFYVPLKQTFTF